MPEYSIFQISKFEKCALQYKFIYVDGIKRYEEGVEAFLGQRFHDAMAWLYKERAFRVVPLEELLEYYEKDWAVSPAKGSAEREGLEQELRTLGVWDEVAALDPFTLEKAVAEGKWAGDVLERIKAYVSIEKRYTVTLKDEDSEKKNHPGRL